MDGFFICVFVRLCYNDIHPAEVWLERSTKEPKLFSEVSGMPETFKNALLQEDYRVKYQQLLRSYDELLHLYNALDQIIENSADAIWVSDANGNCLRVNKAYEALIGMSRSEMLGHSAKSLVGPVVSDICTTHVLASRKVYSFEQTFYLTGRSALVTGTPLFDDSGNITMIVCNDRDMSSLAELSEQLRKSRQMADHYQKEFEKAKEQLSARSNMVVADEQMLTLLNTLSRVSEMDSTVLILGETGVGKEELAKYIHENSLRADEPFVKIDCGAIAPDLIESELFGYEKGAFTGANQKGKIGLFEFADKGTVFLDEIGELPLSMQTKLLRVLQEKKLKRVGSVNEISVDVRIIAATNRDLLAMVEENRFRADLYYRINIFPVSVPPLRERQDDIIPLAKAFLKRLNEKYHTHKVLHFDTISLLRNYRWPGNIRELRNAVEQAFIVCSGETILAEHFFFYKAASSQQTGKEREAMSRPLAEVLERTEYDYMIAAYEQYKNVRDASASLQMSAATFVRKRKLYEEKYGGTT